MRELDQEIEDYRQKAEWVTQDPNLADGASRSTCSTLSIERGASWLTIGRITVAQTIPIERQIYHRDAVGAIAAIMDRTVLLLIDLRRYDASRKEVYGQRPRAFFGAPLSSPFSLGKPQEVGAHACITLVLEDQETRRCLEKRLSILRLEGQESPGLREKFAENKKHLIQQRSFNTPGTSENNHQPAPELLIIRLDQGSTTQQY
ncbi:hypothetical protein WH47_06306 [Habropoda laboriosa]|uniref:Uncharacterized protein n=1 Tax=Habropoda laboriosa TaxID=597456 RepID=A0A0L7RCI8_9HYME|nr:hypothetical protein WH47_06306 [Habropoda laboriosa]